jgi:hypothetical protein
VKLNGAKKSNCWLKTMTANGFAPKKVGEIDPGLNLGKLEQGILTPLLIVRLKYHIPSTSQKACLNNF